jgi:hypothetical protein
MRFTFATVISTLAALAAAHTQPDYSKQPGGNAITSPGLHEQVPEGAAYHIKWEPTEGKTVSLVLLRGPSTNVKPIATIAEQIPNSGDFTWTPSSSLEIDDTHYGLLLVVEGTGQYQYSTQFGIAKGSGSGSSDSGATTIEVDQTTTYCPEDASSTVAPSPTSAPQTVVTVIDDVTTTYCPEEASSTAVPSAPSSVVSTPVVSSPVVSATPSVSAAPSPSAAQSYSTVYESSLLTTTYCPEEASSSGVSPVTSAPAVSTPVAPSGSLTRRPIKSTSSASWSATSSPSGTASATPSAPAYNAAGRTTMSFGAVAAALVALMAF